MPELGQNQPNADLPIFARTEPESARCCQHLDDSGPVLALYYNMFT